MSQLLAKLGFGGNSGPGGAKLVLDSGNKTSEVSDMKRALFMGDYAKVAQMVAGAPNQDQRDFLIDKATRGQGRPPWADGWVEKEPDSALAHLMRGIQSIHWAWEARGSGGAETVGAEQRDVFAERIAVAMEELQLAAEMRPDDPTALSHMITALTAFGDPDKDARSLYERALLIDPTNYMARSLMHMNLCKKWGGSHELMFEQAREVGSMVPLGYAAHSLIADAHYERWMYNEVFEKNKAAADAYFRDEAVLDDLRSVEERYIESPSKVAMGSELEHRNMLAWCYWKAGSMKEAKRQMEWIGGEVTELPWGLYGGATRHYAKVWREIRSA